MLTENSRIFLYPKPPAKNALLSQLQGPAGSLTMNIMMSLFPLQEDGGQCAQPKQRGC